MLGITGFGRIIAGAGEDHRHYFPCLTNATVLTFNCIIFPISTAIEGTNHALRSHCILRDGLRVMFGCQSGRWNFLLLAVLRPPKAIRGGIPICFPQFGNLGSLEQHGFARNRLWTMDSCPSPLPPPKNQSTIDLILKSQDEDIKTWPRSFELRLRVMLSPGKLSLIPRVRNTDSKAFTFTFAMRNYLSVSDVSEVRVEGLETLDYFDNLMQGERFTEQADAITFDGEVDRVYLSTPEKIAIIDHEKKRTLVLRKDGLPDAALWNPWDKKAKALPDFGDEDYKAMLCLDSAAVENPVTLKPSEEWMGHQEMSTVSSSYFSGQLDPCKVLTCS